MMKLPPRLVDFYKKLSWISKGYKVMVIVISVFFVLINMYLISLHPVLPVILVAVACSLGELIVFPFATFLIEIRYIERRHAEFEKEKNDFLTNKDKMMKIYTSRAVSAAMQVIYAFPEFIPGSKKELIDKIISELSKEKN